MKSQTAPILTLVFLVLFTAIASGCAASAASAPASLEQPAGAEPTPQTAPEATAVTIPEQAVPPTAEPTEAPVTAADQPASPQIVHQATPENPVYTQALPGECNTGFNYKIGYRVRPPCDVWGTNLLERAVSSDMSTYYHYIDILSAQLGRSGGWYYASINLFGAGMSTDGRTLTYFFELDVDQNGRGDFLIAAENLDLYATEWSVTGLRVWQDRNGDVGGPTAIRPDSLSGDGYETLIFDQGLGDDPDLAWVRHNPDSYQRIEFAFKPSLLNGAESFMWWAGAMRGDFDPAKFDFVDSHNETQFHEIDTTCGWVFGREKGYNIRKCYVAPNPTKAEKEDDEPAGPAVEICVKPPHPNLEDNSWWWNEAECKWQIVN
jgi:hypothetical protein